VEDVVVPDERRLVDVGMLPGIPREIGLRFAGDEAPADGADFFFFRDWQDSGEGAPESPGHVLGADEWAMGGPEPCDVFFKVGGWTVVVEGDDVGVV